MPGLELGFDSAEGLIFLAAAPGRVSEQNKVRRLELVAHTPCNQGDQRLQSPRLATPKLNGVGIPGSSCSLPQRAEARDASAPPAASANARCKTTLLCMRSSGGAWIQPLSYSEVHNSDRRANKADRRARQALKHTNAAMLGAGCRVQVPKGLCSKACSAERVRRSARCSWRRRNIVVFIFGLLLLSN